MTWKGKQLSVKVVNNSYESGVTVEKDIMNLYETVLYRAKEIRAAVQWFINWANTIPETVIDRLCIRM